MTPAVTDDKALVTVPKWTKAQVQLLQRTVAKGCSEDEMKLFLYICKRSGLDPFLKQIYAYKNWDSDLADFKMIVVTGIDGFRICGDRTQRVAGTPEPVFEVDPNEPWHPSVARVTIKMFSPTGSGEIIEFVGEARWKEFARKKKNGDYMRQWSEQGAPFNQLAKCAEAQGWRKAAPNRTMGLLIREEAIDVDYEVEGEGQQQIADATASIPPDQIQEGILIGYEAPKEMPADKGKKARTRPGSVLIETPQGNVKLTFFTRPKAFADDAAAALAAKEKAACQFSVEVKGEYRNLAHFALKPEGTTGEERPAQADSGVEDAATTPSSPPDDLTILRQDYEKDIYEIRSELQCGELMNRILADKGLPKALRDSLWNLARDKRDSFGKK
jgi:phage recombination protein Bet